MNVLLYSLKLRAEILMQAYQKAYQRIRDNAQNYEVMGSEREEILEYS
jgi:hypothetical protein